MFKDETLESIVINSNAHAEKYVRDQHCQTKPIKYEEKSVQVVRKVEMECQTENELEPLLSTRMRIDTSKNLSNFVLNVYPLVSEQLVANLRSHAFDDYYLLSEEPDDIAEPKCLNTITNQTDKALPEGIAVTALSWNSIGSLVGIGFGMLEHLSWCTHQSAIYLSSINRKDDAEPIQPDKVLNTDSCISSLAFSPLQPALLVSGNFTGRIDVWDISKEDHYLVAMSGKGTVSHDEMVNEIRWIQPSSNKHQFITVGSDGNIFMWSYDQLRQDLSLNKRFSLSSDVIPRGMRTRLLKSGVNIGITCLAIPSAKGNVLYVGTENGCVFKCTEVVKNTSKEADFVIQSYEGHQTNVNTIDVSSFTEDLFLTGGADMYVHVYNSVQAAPLHKIDIVVGAVIDLKWSLSSSKLFYVSTSTGKLFIYELKESDPSQLHVISLSKAFTPSQKISINAVRTNVMATSFDNTMVKVWRFPNF